jgi:hypothetical protein
LERYSEFTEVLTVDDPRDVEIEGSAQVCFVDETVRSSELMSKYTSHESIKLDAPAQDATPPASYSEVARDRVSHLLVEEKADKSARAKGDEVFEETDEDNSIWSYLNQDSGMC